jgi:hypothetical protein
MHATVVWSTQFTNRDSTNDIALADAWEGIGFAIGRPDALGLGAIGVARNARSVATF